MSRTNWEQYRQLITGQQKEVETQDMNEQVFRAQVMEQHRVELQAQMQYKQERAAREKEQRLQHQAAAKEAKRVADVEHARRHQKKVEDVNHLKHHLIQTNNARESGVKQDVHSVLQQDKARNQRAAEAVQWHKQENEKVREQFKNARIKDVQQKRERNDYEQKIIRPSQKEEDKQMIQNQIQRRNEADAAYKDYYQKMDAQNQRRTDAYRQVIDNQTQKQIERQQLIENNERKYHQQLADKAKQEQIIRQAMAEDQSSVIQIQLKEQQHKRKQEAEQKRFETEQMTNLVNLNHSYSLDMKNAREQQKKDYYNNLKTQTKMKQDRDRYEKLMGYREQRVNNSILQEKEGNKTIGFVQQPGAAPRISPLKAAILGRQAHHHVAQSLSGLNTSMSGPALPRRSSPISLSNHSMLSQNSESKMKAQNIFAGQHLPNYHNPITNPIGEVLPTSNLTRGKGTLVTIGSNLVNRNI